MLLPTSPEHCRNRWALSKSVAVNIPPCCIQGGLGEGGGAERRKGEYGELHQRNKTQFKVTCTNMCSRCSPPSHNVQKEKVELQKSFSSWKLRHMDDKREVSTKQKQILISLQISNT